MDILLLEDSATCAELTQALLHRGDTPVDCTVVISMADGLALLAEHRYDLVVLDLTLVDTLGLPTEVRTIFQAAKGVPVLVYSGAHAEQEPEILGEGAGAYLSKGTSAERLWHVIRRLVPHGRTHRTGA